MQFISIRCIMLTKEKINMNPDQNTNNEQPDQTSEQPIAPPPSRVDVNSIYPTPGEHHYDNRQPLNDLSIDNKPEALNFKQGYSIGGKIFWWLLLVGIVMSLVSFSVISFLYGTKNVSSIATTLSFCYLFELLAIIYTVFRILRSNELGSPFWFTIFGLATEFIVTVAAGIAIAIPTYLLFASKGVSNSVPTHNTFTNNTFGGGFYYLVIFIVFFVFSYFITKLTWGLSFFLLGKIKNKVIVKVIDIIFISLFLLLMAAPYILQKVFVVGLISSTNNTNVEFKLDKKAYVDPTTGYHINLPTGWTIEKSWQPPVSDKSSMSTTTHCSYNKNGNGGVITIYTESPSSGSLDLDYQEMMTRNKSMDYDYTTGYRLVSADKITVNDIPAYYAIYSYVSYAYGSKTAVPGSGSGQEIIEYNKGTRYNVFGSSSSKYGSPVANILKQSLMSFRP